jgi:hypothetical protein
MTQTAPAAPVTATQHAPAAGRPGDLLAVTPHVVITRQVSAAEIWYVEMDGERHIVALYTRNDHVTGAERSCFNDLCPHMMSVLAVCGKPQET